MHYQPITCQWPIHLGAASRLGWVLPLSTCHVTLRAVSEVCSERPISVSVAWVYNIFWQMTNEMLISVIQVIFLLCIRCNIADKNVVFPLRTFASAELVGQWYYHLQCFVIFVTLCAVSEVCCEDNCMEKRQVGETLKVIPGLWQDYALCFCSYLTVQTSVLQKQNDNLFWTAIDYMWRWTRRCSSPKTDLRSDTCLEDARHRILHFEHCSAYIIL